MPFLGPSIIINSDDRFKCSHMPRLIVPEMVRYFLSCGDLLGDAHIISLPKFGLDFWWWITLRIPSGVENETKQIFGTLPGASIFTMPAILDNTVFTCWIARVRCFKPCVLECCSHDSSVSLPTRWSRLLSKKHKKSKITYLACLNPLMLGTLCFLFVFWLVRRLSRGIYIIIYIYVYMYMYIWFT